MKIPVPIRWPHGPSKAPVHGLLAKAVDHVVAGKHASVLERAHGQDDNQDHVHERLTKQRGLALGNAHADILKHSVDAKILAKLFEDFVFAEDA